MQAVMRAWLALGAAVLTLAGGLDAAQARARVRVSTGRTVEPHRPAIPVPAAAAAPIGAPVRVGDPPAVAVTPVRAAPAGTAVAVPAVVAAEANAAAEAAPTPQRVNAPPVPATPRIREVRAMAPPCEAGRRVGGITREEAGFCLIN
jgi:hypothetical protein